MIWISSLSIIFMLQKTGVINTENFVTSKNNGWWSILTGPFLHGGFSHFSGNIVGLVVGSSLLLNLYKKMYWRVMLLGLIIPPTIMYLLGGNSLGISGLVFATLWFVAIRGVLSLNWLRFLIGIVIILFYGSSLKSAFPIASYGIAWQAHFAGLITAIIMAIYSRLK